MNVVGTSCLLWRWGRIWQKKLGVKKNNKQGAQTTIITYYESEKEIWSGGGVLEKANVRNDAGCRGSVMLVMIITFVRSGLTLIV